MNSSKEASFDNIFDGFSRLVMFDNDIATLIKNNIVQQQVSAVYSLWNAN